MPYLLIRTNRSVEDTETHLARVSRETARLLGKPEAYVMVSLEQRVPMRFAGSADPAVYLELKSIGLPEQRSAELSEALCRLMAEELGVGPERVYIELTNAQRHLWGWNGGTF